METTVVITTVALLAVFALPAIRGLFNSLESRGSTKAMINAALSSARAMALKNQKYTGIRFQEDLAGRQYIIFIINDPVLGANFSRAVEGIEPIKLPDSVGVMDWMVRLNLSDADDSNDEPIYIDSKIDQPEQLTDTTSFSVIFSPAGKLVTHELRVRNRDGQTANSLTDSDDDIFNKVEEVNMGKALFYQDDYAYLGLGKEPSRRSFVIYDKNKFKQIDEDRRWTDYLEDLPRIYMNPYTGTMINK